MEKLEEIAAAMEKTAEEAGVHIVSGDTKVAGRGQVDGVFITTTGMGEIEEGVTVGGALAQAGRCHHCDRRYRAARMYDPAGNGKISELMPM